MDNHEKKIKNLLNRSSKTQKTKRINKTQKNADKRPINDSQLTIRELKHNDKYDLLKIVSENRRDYYINVYKKTFRSWFTYLITGALLAVSLTLVNSKMSGICLPPLLITVFLLWKVNKYKKLNHNLNVNDMELLNQTETIYYKFKSEEHRRANQGVLIAFLKENKSLEDYDLDDLSLSDLDTDSDTEEKLNEKNKKLVAYLIYNKQRDELETVCIKEICVHKDYRRRKIATHFIRQASKHYFKQSGFRRVTFQVSNFNKEALTACLKNLNLVNKIYSWIAFNFIPGVYDQRNVFAFNINQLNY